MPSPNAYEAQVQMYPTCNVVTINDDGYGYPLGDEPVRLTDMLYYRIAINAASMNRESLPAALQNEVEGCMRDLGDYLKSDEYVSKLTSDLLIRFAEAKAVSHG